MSATSRGSKNDKGLNDSLSLSDLDRDLALDHKSSLPSLSTSAILDNKRTTAKADAQKLNNGAQFAKSDSFASSIGTSDVSGSSHRQPTRSPTEREPKQEATEDVGSLKASRNSFDSASTDKSVASHPRIASVENVVKESEKDDGSNHMAEKENDHSESFASSSQL
jgi:hypothetical protein